MVAWERVRELLKRVMIPSSSEGLLTTVKFSYPIIPSGINPSLELGPHKDREKLWPGWDLRFDWNHHYWYATKGQQLAITEKISLFQEGIECTTSIISVGYPSHRWHDEFDNVFFIRNLLSSSFTRCQATINRELSKDDGNGNDDARKQWSDWLNEEK